MSIVIATLNVARDLERTIKNICEQFDDCVEILIVDGGSTDGTSTVLEKYRERIQWKISEPDKGIYDAWNKAIPHAVGRWICFLGAGDSFASSHTLADIRPYLREAESKKLPVVYGRTFLVNNRGERLYCYGEPWPDIKDTWLKSGYGLCHTGLFHHISIFKERRFDSSFRIAGDYEFLLPELLRHEALFINIDVATWQVGGVSTVPNRRLQTLRELARARGKHGLKERNLKWYFEFAKAVVKIIILTILGDRVGSNLTNLFRRLTGRAAIKME